MKALLILICALTFGTTLISTSAILGREKCTWGPGYWCSNITNAKSCGAVKHCIKTVWENQHVPEDKDSICQICLDMVKQARDQLESNETMDEIRQVFEGSCALIPIKPVANECKKLADDFIPEMVEALASQMNPQVVCSTAGLCNNAEIDKLLEEYERQKTTSLLSCGQCNNIGNVISEKFHTSSRDEVLDGFLAACGGLSSFSDACSSIIITYFDDIYAELSKNLEADKICHMSGVCSSKFHQHKPTQVEIQTKSNVGFVKPADDLPCELCEQLVKHLRDILVANTTEIEFKTVLEGLCKQTKGFKEECVSLVDQYYPILYETLVNNLDANGACFMIGVCPKGNKLSVPFMPLLPTHVNVPPKKKLGVNEKVLSNDEIKTMILPIDKLMGPKSSLKLVENGQFCTVCQYFLHYIQEELSDAKTEDEIKEAVGRTCDKFPTSVRSNCHQFVNLYGDSVIALLVQEIDPRELCPSLKLCPKTSDDVDVFAPFPIDVNVNTNNKPTCPLCVLVVKEAQDYIKSSKSKEVAKKALEKVCSRLPPKPQLQCNDFVETYYDELLAKLLSDFTPMDICKDLELCPSNSIRDEEDDSDDIIEIVRVGIEKVDYIPHIDTNEISDFTVNGRRIDDSGECMLCVEVISGAEQKITKDMTKQQVEEILLRECSRFRSYEGVCDNFVKNNVDQLSVLVTKELAPKQVCQKLLLCAVPQDLDIDEAIVVNVVAVPAFPSTFGRVALTRDEPPPKGISDDPMCVLCEFVMTKLEEELKDKTTQDEIEDTIKNICSKMPKSISKKCNKFVDQYAELIISLIDTVPPKQICQQMSLCSAVKRQQTLVGDSECTWGPSHFCSDVKIANKCKATQYCKQKKLGMFA